MIHGGPGSRGLTQRNIWHGLDLVPGADMVVFDQRGAGGSAPKPCPNGLRGLRAIIAADLPWRETVERTNAKWRECRARLDSADVDPDDFGTSVTTQDVELLRRALKIERWNIFTGSYGTAVAMDLMAAHPETIRAVAMFGLTLPEGSPEEVDSALDIAIERRATLCRAEPACRSRFPNLAESFRRAVAELDARPLALTVPGYEFEGDRFMLNGREFEYFIDGRLLSTADAARVPYLIGSALTRDAASLSGMVGEAIRGMDEQDVFARLAVHCRDKARYHRPRPTVRGYVLGQLPDVCRHWSALGPVRRVPDNTSIPTLLLQGELDTTTPSRNAEIVVERLGPKARLLLFPSVGHTVGINPGCEQQLVISFFRRPEAPLPTARGARGGRRPDTAVRF